jgi:hypothetical protein
MRPKKAYDDQRRHSSDRGIPWLFTYEEWLEMWLLSGKWEKRGRCKGQYQMCREGDEGAYSARNCYIDTVESNQKDRHNVDDDETLAILNCYKFTTMTQREIGDMFNLHQSSISRIIKGERRLEY